MVTKREWPTWSDLEGQIAPEVFRAPKTSADPDGKGTWPEGDSRIITYLQHTVSEKCWMNHLALIAVVLAARRREVSTILNILTSLHCRFKTVFPLLKLTDMAEWKPDIHICTYLRGEIQPKDTDEARSRFLKDYNASTKQLQAWAQSLPDEERVRYQPFILPPVTRGLVEGLDKRKEVEQQQRQNRKAETDAVVPQFSTLRVEAHLRYNRILRLRQASHQALKEVLPDRSNLPLNFSYDEGDPPQERLFFRVWDRRTFTLAHDYQAEIKDRAERGMYTCADERNGLFLEFVRAERLSGNAPPEGLWFTELLKMDVLGQVHCKKDWAIKRAWLEAWGYRDHISQKGCSPFWTQVSSLLAWSAAGGDSAFMSTAQEKAEGVLLRHAFATHAVRVEKIPIDIVGEWLKQKSLDVTDYYSQPTESMVAEAVDLYLARTAVSIDLGKAVQRTPQELQQLYEQAKGKAGTFADVIGGQCVSHGFCAAKFACVGCPGKVPDPAKRLQLEKHKVWALQQVSYANEEGLLPEAERMRQLARDCETELQEIEAIEAYRKDEKRAVSIRLEARE